MSDVTVIDADGHITESTEQLRPHFEGRYGDRGHWAGRRSYYPEDGWDRVLDGRLGSRAPAAPGPPTVSSPLRGGGAAGVHGGLPRDGAGRALLRSGRVRQVRGGAYALSPVRSDDPADRHDLRGRARALPAPEDRFHGGRLHVGPLLDGPHGRGVGEARGGGSAALPEEAERVPAQRAALLRRGIGREVPARGGAPRRRRHPLLRQ